MNVENGCTLVISTTTAASFKFVFVDHSSQDLASSHMLRTSSCSIFSLSLTLFLKVFIGHTYYVSGFDPNMPREGIEPSRHKARVFEARVSA